MIALTGKQHIALMIGKKLSFLQLLTHQKGCKVAKRSKSPAQIKAEIQRLNSELAQAEAREGERIGALAVKSGLHEINCSDADFIKAFKEIAARFRSAHEKSEQTA
ncbi:MAG: TraC family protein [Pelagibacterium sp.]|jgi:hypothetical protein|uniref:TraC family protein n=1 Tax=Pelagibacterium sp. TaxID=1967288 RepID=UPI0032EBE675|tara:strand:+ start:11578 stop:11895 length:318 start_codon:yes stop_codon:yes gene_type:complete